MGAVPLHHVEDGPAGAPVLVLGSSLGAARATSVSKKSANPIALNDA
jgi:hypothetical protein